MAESNLLHEATVWAAEVHAGFDDEGAPPLPYFFHPVEVAGYLARVGVVTDKTMLCGAILHDTVESGVVTDADVRKKFGQEVADLVKELTRREPSSKEIAGLDPDEIWALRSEILLAEIADMSERAQQIKLADRLANLNEAQRTKRGKKMLRYLNQSKRILKIIPRRVNPALWKAVKTKVEELGG